MIDVPPAYLQIVLDILKTHAPDCEVRVFGSRFKWTARDYSDLDLALVGPDKLHWKTLARLKAALEESSLPFRVDVLDWHAISPEFQQVIEQGYEVIQDPKGLKRPLGSAPSSKEWKKYRLEDIAVFYDSKRVPLNSRERGTRKGNYPYYGASGIVDYIDDYLFDGEYVLISEDGENLRSRSTPIAFKASEKFWVNNHAHVIQGKEPFLNDWITYFFRNLDLNPYITGAVQPKLNRENLQLIEIPLPAFDKAQRIVSILSALDDKIELNRQINATLEAIAQAIFKEWFVDFNYPDPKGLSRPLGSREMIESELGMIPQGWRAGKLGEVCDITMGQSPPGESYNEVGNGIPFFQGRTDFNFRFPTRRVFTTDPKRYAKKFDTLVSVRAPVGDMNIAAEDCCIGRGLASVIHKQKLSSFTYYFLKELTIKFKGYEDNGTVFGSINKSEFESMECLIPDENSVVVFENTCRPIDDIIFNNEHQSATLAALRDALLPKLMSGEIDVGARIHTADSLQP